VGSTLGVAQLPYTSMAVSIVLAVLLGTLEMARAVVGVPRVVDVNLVGGAALLSEPPQATSANTNATDDRPTRRIDLRKR
jgi:hypothetical protein